MAKEEGKPLFKGVLQSIHALKGRFGNNVRILVNHNIKKEKEAKSYKGQFGATPEQAIFINEVMSKK